MKDGECDLDVIETERLLDAVTSRFAYAAFIGVKPGCGAPKRSNVTIHFCGDNFAVYGAVNILRDGLRDTLKPTIETEEA